VYHREKSVERGVISVTNASCFSAIDAFLPPRLRPPAATHARRRELSVILAPAMQPIRIEARTGSGAYPIVIGAGIARRLGRLLDDLGAPGRRVVVSSPRIWRLHGGSYGHGLASRRPILIPDGERRKTLATVAGLYDGLLAAGVDRGSAVVAVGGGVVGDVAGFAAATYLRGVAVVHAPTTLLAQVDSAIGGKVGVNHARGKNLIGAFHMPAAVVADVRALATLSPRQLRSGLFEVVKYGVIADADLLARTARDLDRLIARDEEALARVIAECVRIKAAITAADEREQGLRRALNFGHTVGHALEAVTSYRRFTHGEAVGVGMRVAARIAAARGGLSGDDLAALEKLIARLGPAPSIRSVSARSVLTATRTDKKIVGGALHFVLPTRLGAVRTTTDVSDGEVSAALRSVGFSA
jgi:3-dehydroquinate synthase